MDLEDFEFAVARRFPAAFPRRGSPLLPTPRALIDYLAARAPAGADARSIKQHAFYRVRALLARELGTDPRRVRPATPLAALLPEPAAARRRHWAAIRAALGVPEVPRLRRPARVERGIALAAGAAFLAAGVLAARHLAASGVLPAAAAAGAAVLAGALRATERRASGLPAWPATVGDLAAAAAAYGSPLLDPALAPTSRAQVLEVVRELARLELGAVLGDEDRPWAELAESAPRAA